MPTVHMLLSSLSAYSTTIFVFIRYTNDPFGLGKALCVRQHQTNTRLPQYALLKEEMAREGGIHALQLKTMTPEEDERQRQKEAEESS